MAAIIIPLVVAVVFIYALFKKIDVYSAFIDGAKKGLSTVYSIFPAVVGMLTAIAMLRASGAIDALAGLLAPAFHAIGVPQECIPLALLRPFSGSGALSIGADIIQSAGPDSRAGLVAAVMLGSSETSLYTIAIYSSALGIKNSRYAVAAALIGDFAAFFASAIAVNLLLL